MKKHFTRIMTAALAVFLLVSSFGSALACTGLYVGKDVSADGSIIIGRCEDIGAVYDKLQTYVPASDEAGRVMTDEINGFSYPLPTHTHGYTQMEDYPDAGDGLYAAVCVNDVSVSITGTVSASGCAAWREADPTVEEGLREAVLPALAAATASTAKEAVEVLCGAVDTYGSAEGNIILIADQHEAWILEIYGGKHYVAMKLPDDQVAVFGNHFMIGAIDPEDTENFVVSEGFAEALEEAGLTKKDEDGKILAAQSVCDGARSAGNNLRNWGGMHLLAPSLAGEEFDNDTFYPLLYTPDEKVTLQDVFEVYRCRYEGTPYDLSLEGQEGNRAIAVSGTPDTHVIQLFENMPAAHAAVNWLAFTGAEHSVFMPEIAGITELPAAFGVDAPSYNTDSAYWAFKRICGLADTNRALYSEGVQNFWKIQEEAFIAQMPAKLAQVKALAEADPDAAVDYVNTDLANTYSDVLKKSDALYSQLLTLVSRNAGYASSRWNALAPKVPLRTAAEAKGYTVTWDAAAKAAVLTKGSVTKTVPVNGKDAVLIGDVTYVPYSFVEGL